MVAVFSRDNATGALTFVEVQEQGVGGVGGLDDVWDVEVSPDGEYVYTASEGSSVAVFSRDSTTGALTFEEFHQDGVAGVDGIDFSYSVAVSPDGENIYATGYYDNAVAVFGQAEPVLCNGLLATIIGTDGKDTLLGTGGDDVIVGLAGDDIILGKGGNDTICAGPGEDVVKGGAGRDWVSGGPGDDVVLGEWGHDRRLAGDGGDDMIRGGPGNDKLFGGPGHDALLGGIGNDRLVGRGGADMIAGGDGDDNIDCGSGFDFANGGPGTGDTATANCTRKANIP